MSNLKQAVGMENGQRVRFYQHMVYNPETKQHDPRDYIEAQVPTARSGFSGPVKEHHKRRFPKTWAAFQSKEAFSKKGTPIESLPSFQNNPQLLEDYSNVGIVLVEDMCGLESDEAIHNLPLGRKVYAEAKAWQAAMRENVRGAVDGVVESMSEIAKRLDELEGKSKKRGKGAEAA